MSAIPLILPIIFALIFDDVFALSFYFDIYYLYARYASARFISDAAAMPRAFTPYFITLMMLDMLIRDDVLFSPLLSFTDD